MDTLRDIVMENIDDVESALRSAAGWADQARDSLKLATGR